MFKENFMIIMENGSEKEVVENITGIVDMMIKKRYGKTISRMLDESNPDLRVIVVRATYKNFNVIREIIEAQYPKFCTFKHV